MIYLPIADLTPMSWK